MYVRREALKIEKMMNEIISYVSVRHIIQNLTTEKSGSVNQKEKFVVKEGSSMRTEVPKSAISHVDEDYIHYRNERCIREVKIRLGIIPWIRTR